jgi:4-amino-4-deoxy-L-arabinose transferase-like glycosyltransferase
MSAMAVAVTYLWGTAVYASLGLASARLCALVAAGSFALMPRVFYHAHLDCFDMPVLAMWMVTSYAYWRSLGAPGLRWPLLAAILYGLLLNTKHNSWLLPFALVGHWALWRGPEAWRLLRQKQWAALLRTIPVALWLMATLGPLLFYATWPWIWFDTFDRLVEYVKFHTQHVYYNMEFLGRTYFEPPFPRLYAPLMTLGTVPAVTLALFGAGLALYGRELYRRVRSRAPGASADVVAPTERPSPDALATLGLWLLFILISYSPWVSNQSPIFGGTKHWITAYPFMALFAGLAFGSVLSAARSACRASGVRARVLEWGLAVSALIAPLVITQHSHPWGLTAYTPIVGGAPGAASLGLNRSFWGYTTGAVVEEINELAPRGTKVFIHDTAMSSWRMMVADGRLRADLRPQLGVAFSRLAVYHHEQHMSRVEHQIWVDYGTVSPAHIGSYDGVPVVWLYRRPE